jgi:hypothetical protein
MGEPRYNPGGTPGFAFHGAPRGFTFFSFFDTLEIPLDYFQLCAVVLKEGRYVKNLRYLWKTHHHRQFGQPRQKSYPAGLEAQS